MALRSDRGREPVGPADLAPPARYSHRDDRRRPRCMRPRRKPRCSI